jgi:hypothetical protein
VTGEVTGAESKVEFIVGPKLNSIRSYGIITGEPDPCMGGVQDSQDNSFRVWKRQGWWTVLGMETSDRNEEVCVVPPCHQKSHGAVDGIIKDTGFEKACIKIKPFLVWFKRTCEINLQYKEGGVLVGKGDFKNTNDRNGRPGQFNDDTQGYTDKCRCPPADLCHGSYEEQPFLGREDGFQVTYDTWSIGNHVLWEHDTFNGPSAYPLHEGFQFHRTVETKQTAYAKQDKSISELEPWLEFGGNDNKQ